MTLRVMLVVVMFLVTSSLASQGRRSHRNKHKNLGDHLDNTDLTDEASKKDLFDAWKTKHGINFKNPEEQDKAYGVLVENAKKIKKHRNEHSQGKHSYTVALNKFSHLTFGDWKTKSLGFKNKPKQSFYASKDLLNRKERKVAIPSSLDLRTQGYVTPVKDQGSCGCCWAFSTTGVLEGAYYKKNKKLVSFSEEDLVECFSDYAGCDGGVPTDAVYYIKSTGQLATEDSYPFTAGDGYSYSQSCLESSGQTIPLAPRALPLSQDDNQLITALNTYGPVSVAIAVADPFKHYESGIIDPDSACDTTINHAVLLVGYGADQATGQKYWIVKNSWNTDWGESGYFRLSRDVQNSCGINEQTVAVKL